MRGARVLLLAVLVGSCAGPAAHVVAPTQGKDLVFTFSGGPCPEYQVEVFDDLSARFTGSRDTREHGAVAFNVTPHQLEALRAMKLQYWAHKLLSGGCGFDVSHCLRVEKKIESRWVGICLCEAQIGSAEKDLLSIAGVTEWAAQQRECPAGVASR
jgi:hypothetical protein